MLYLAEVQKKAGVFGSGKVELKLWAQQRAEDRWQGLTGTEVLGSDKGADKAAECKDGALVLVDVNDRNGQIQRIQDATKTLVSNLQNSSRLKDKLKDQEDEIEQWKQSLTYQSQELNRREMEMESRREQMQQLEEDLKRLEEQKQEALSLQNEAQRLRSELDSRDQDLQKAWQQLQQEQQALEARLAGAKGSGGLNEQQIQQLQGAVQRIHQTVMPVDGLLEQVNHGVEALKYQRAIVDRHLQQMDVYHNQAQSLQEGVNHLRQSWDDQWRAYGEGLDGITQMQVEMAVRQHRLESCQAQLAALYSHIEVQEKLQKQINFVIGGLDPESVNQIDFVALESMALADLEQRVQELQKAYDRDRHFVGDQDEELALISQDIEAKQQQIAAASEYERLTLEGELADLQSQYSLINESVSPQRNRLRQDKGILAAYQLVLRRRKGDTSATAQETDLDVKPILDFIEIHKAQLQGTIATLEQSQAEDQGALEQLQHNLREYQQQVNHQRQELHQVEEDLRNQMAAVAERWSQVRTYLELLQPTQETLNNLDGQLGSIHQELQKLHNNQGEQQREVEGLQQVLKTLG